MSQKTAALCEVSSTLSRRALPVLLVLVTAAGLTRAQTKATDGSTPAGLASGAPAGSYSLSGFDNVNLYNGSLNFRLPLVSVGGRGGAGHAVLLPVERHWMVEQFDDGMGGVYNYPVDGREEETGPGYGPGVMHQRYGATGKFTCNDFPPPEEPRHRYLYALTRLAFTGPDGTEYEFRDQLTGGQKHSVGTNCNATGFNRGKVFVSVDGSAATFISDTDVIDPVLVGGAMTDYNVSGYLKLRDGSVYRVDGGLVSWLRDRNGNKVTFAYDANRRVTAITDSLNRQVTVAYDVSDVAPYGLCDKITYKGFNGAQRVIRVSKASLGALLRAGFALQTPAYLFPGIQGSNYSYYNPTVVSAVWLPNGKSYQFQYDSHAELSRVTLPTGGAFEYDFAPGTTNGYGNGVVYVYSDRPQIYRRVVERRVYADGVNLTSRMTYSRPETEGGTCCAVSTVGYVVAEARDAAGTLLAKTQHYFHGPGAAPTLFQLPTTLNNWQEGKEYQADTYDTNGTTVLRRTVNTWQVGTPISSSPSTGINGRISEITSTVEPAGANKVSKQTFSYDQFNNQTDVYDYDYGSGAPGSLIRRTHTDYLVTNPVNGADYTGTSIHLRGLPAQTSVYDVIGTEKAKTTFEYDNYASDANHAPLAARSGISGLDSTFTTSYQTRGNLTRVSRVILPAGTTVSAHTQYDVAGNAVKVIDARGYATTADFSDRFGAPDDEARSNTPPAPLGGQTSYAFATKVTNALGHTSYAQLDYYTGAAVNGEETNGVVASGYYNDPLDRPTQAVAAVGTGAQSQTTFAYDDAGRVITTTADLNSYGDNQLKSQSLYDELGRTFESRQYESSTNYIAAQRSYDALGRAYRLSHPYRPWQGESPQWTTTQFDALGRATLAMTPDGAQVTTVYSGLVVTVTDQAGKQRSSEANALGWTTSVAEAPNDPSYNYQTTYSYDVLGNPTHVTQGVQTRAFAYDSLGRLTSATNPESGTVSYQYDANGKVTQRTDARNVTTTYAYDELGRPASKTYNDSPATPQVNYYYDAQTLPAGSPTFDRGYSTGRLVAVTYGGVSAGVYRGYDLMGHVARQVQQTDGVNYLVEETHNLAGGLTGLTYPAVPGYADRRSVSYSYDGAARLSALTSAATSFAAAASVSSIGYASHGAPSTETFGNGLVHTVLYNNRLQPGQIRLGTSGAPSSVLGLTYDYGTTNNNGDILSVTYGGGGLSYTQSFSYDPLNRLTTAQENSGVSWSQTNGYDRYGNRWVALGGGSQSLYFNTATNRINGWGYDAAGNLLNDLANNYSYDAEGRLKTVNGSTAYAYDGEGRRVRKYLGEATRFVYGTGGELLAEYDGSTGALRKEYVHGGGGMVTVEPGVGVKYAVGDNLGTPRVVTNSAGAVVSRHDYQPFGGELFAGTGGRTTAMGYSAADGVRQRFTGYERDAETGLDYAQARYYAAAQGRFTTPDPFSGSMAGIDPQTLNRYSYVTNNPLIFSDPSGMAPSHAALRAMQTGDFGSLARERAGDYTAEDASLYEGRLADTYKAIDEANALNGMLREGQITNQEARDKIANNPMLEAVVPLPTDLRDRVESRVNNPDSGCKDFVMSVIAEAGKIDGKAFSTDPMTNYDRIQREGGFKLKEQEEKGTANFDGNKRVVYIKPVATSSDPRKIDNVRNNYAGTALSEVIHHAKNSGVYGDRTMAKAVFKILSPAEQKANPLPRTNDQGTNSRYWHPLVLNRCQP